MANITKEISDIKNAMYGGEVKSAFINALLKINEENKDLQELKEKIFGDTSNIEKIVSDAEERIDSKLYELNNMLEELKRQELSMKVYQRSLDILIRKGGSLNMELDNKLKG